MNKRYTQLYKSELIAALGSQSEIARKLDISRQAVSLWKEELAEITCLQVQVYLPAVFRKIVKKRQQSSPPPGQQ